jgi:hypothetical protein
LGVLVGDFFLDQFQRFGVVSPMAGLVSSRSLALFRILSVFFGAIRAPSAPFGCLARAVFAETTFVALFTALGSVSSPAFLLLFLS